MKIAKDAWALIERSRIAGLHATPAAIFKITSVKLSARTSSKGFAILGASLTSSTRKDEVAIFACLLSRSCLIKPVNCRQQQVRQASMMILMADVSYAYACSSNANMKLTDFF